MADLITPSQYVRFVSAVQKCIEMPVKLVMPSHLYRVYLTLLRIPSFSFFTFADYTSSFLLLSFPFLSCSSPATFPRNPSISGLRFSGKISLFNHPLTYSPSISRMFCLLFPGKSQLAYIKPPREEFKCLEVFWKFESV